MAIIPSVSDLTYLFFFPISGDWHTAYLLLYGPRKLSKDYKKPSTEEAKASEKASEVEKMET